MIQQDYLKVFGRPGVFSDQNVAWMGVTVDESMLKDHVCENLDESFSHCLGVEAHILDFLLLSDLFTFDKIHDNYAV